MKLFENAINLAAREVTAGDIAALQARSKELGHSSVFMALDGYGHEARIIVAEPSSKVPDRNFAHHCDTVTIGNEVKPELLEIWMEWVASTASDLVPFLVYEAAATQRAASNTPSS